MKINIIPVSESTIEEFADKYGLVIEVRERREFRSNNERWYASFKNVEIILAGTLLSDFGNGSTPEKAIQQYARCISEKSIAVNAHTKKRQNIIVPRLISNSSTE